MLIQIICKNLFFPYIYLINPTLSSISTGYEEDSLASGERDAGMEMEGEGEYVDIEGEDVSILDCLLNFRIPGMGSVSF